MESDLPPSTSHISEQLVNYLQQLIYEADKKKVNPKKLRAIVAFFEDETPRFYTIPDSITTEIGWVADQHPPIEATRLIRRTVRCPSSLLNPTQQSPRGYTLGGGTGTTCRLPEIWRGCVTPLFHMFETLRKDFT